MATRKKKANRKPGRAGRLSLWALVCVCALLLITLGAGAIHATSLHVRRAEVKLKQLPERFDGVTLLYASDIDLMGLNTPARAADLFRRLQQLKPDMLVLGGDYTSSSLLDILNRGSTQGGAEPRVQGRNEFIRSLTDFDAPLGKFAIRAPEDDDPAGLAAALTAAGIRPLFDASAAVKRDGASIYLAGLTGDTGAIARAAASARGGDCIIAIAPSPAQLPQIMINEVSGGGAWCDMILTGHTHGGQIRLFGAEIIGLSEVERSHLSGWQTQSGIPTLTTTGVGCEGMNVRLGSDAEVWLITLRCADGVVLPELR